MKKLTLEFANMEKDIIVEINNKIVDFKKPKSKQKRTTIEYETENDFVDLKIKRVVPIGAKKWFWWQVLFYFVSLFGLLDKPQNKKCCVIDYNATIALTKDEVIRVVMHISKKSQKAVELLTEASVQEIKNELKIDKTAKRRLNIYTTIKVISWILILIVLGYVIISTLL